MYIIANTSVSKVVDEIQSVFRGWAIIATEGSYYAFIRMPASSVRIFVFSDNGATYIDIGNSINESVRMVINAFVGERFIDDISMKIKAIHENGALSDLNIDEDDVDSNVPAVTDQVGIMIYV